MRMLILVILMLMRVIKHATARAHAATANAANIASADAEAAATHAVSADVEGTAVYAVATVVYIDQLLQPYCN
jgi:hypothetical protein